MTFYPQMTQMNADEENRAAFICEHLRHLRIKTGD
jgi:hypothetical protein